MGTFFKALPDVLIFELTYKLMLMAIGAPALALLLKLTMKISNVNYLSDEKIWIYLKNPATIVAILLILFFSAVSSFIELSALTACFSCYSHGERLSVIGMFRTGFYSLRKAFRGKGAISFLKFMIYIPIAQFTISSGIFLTPILPMLRNAFDHLNLRGSAVLYVGLQALFAIVIVSRCYSLHYLVLTDRPLNECTKESRKIIDGKKLKSAVSLLLWGLFIIAAATVITFILSFIIILLIKGISNPHKAFLMSLKVLRYEAEIFSAVSAVISAPAVMCWLTGRFFADVPASERIKLPDRKDHRLNTLPRVIVYTAVILAGLLLNYSYIEAVYKGNVSLNVGVLTRTQVTAHRGSSRVAPENTLYAFEEALASGADYIELDVQLTADEQLVVFHDEKLDRTTDGTGKLSDYTYDELMKLSAGSWFRKNGEFDDAKIPLLSEVLELADDGILLNIEIKDHGDTIRTAEKTVEVIKEYDFEDSCYVTSFSYAAVKKVKQLDPDIKTGLIANVATTTAFTQLKYIDALSMNHLLVNSTVVNDVHQNGKRIFVWTVDNKSEMKNMMALGVDNIITNRPDLAAEIVYSSDVSEKILTILKTVFGSY